MEKSVKNYLVILMVIIGIVGCGEADEKQEKKTKKLESKEILVEKIKTYIEKGDDKPRIVAKWSYEYDDLGNLIKEIKFSREENSSEYEKSRIFEYKYDEKGRIIEEEKKYFEAKVYEKKTYRYNEKDQLVRETTYTDQNLYFPGKKTKERIIYEYYSDGKIGQKTYLDYKMFVWWIGYPLVRAEDKYQYNKDNNLIFRLLSVFKGGKPKVNIYKNKYNEKGQLIEEYKSLEVENRHRHIELEMVGKVNWKERAKKIRTHLYKYDYLGRKIQEIVKNGDGKRVIEIYFNYNKDGSYVRKYFDYKEEQKRLSSFSKYDNRDLYTEWKFYNDEELRSHYKYEYNRDGKRTLKFVKRRNSDGELENYNKMEWKYNRNMKLKEYEWISYDYDGKWRSVVKDKYKYITNN